ncbi:extracellular solute-binding protein [Halopelagius longus]|uniref:ABC-type glycerol-3-phosphate transport system, substrate-binding protein n=1 Tax=Halopelagius longus TaxID=1236180 RepID=A0A1H1G2G4_9EURY|nr:extracellular solute-binding protein [Halopelagius longus]RDI69883.1 extracellular solute-binding protein [Halopelagius longus]SDR07422.1 ABC-type glycerol-3-phosphate transport system, substrate-binding protein [Halopelagius longus]
MVRDSDAVETGSRSDGSYASRRRFLSAAASAGITVGLAGCSSGGGSGQSNGENTVAPEDAEYDGSDVTVEYSTAPLFGNSKETLMQTLYDVGLPKSIDVNFTTTVWGADDLQDRYNQILSAGRSTPDLMLTNFAYTPFFAPREWLLDLNQVLSEEKLGELDDHSQVIVDSMTWDGGLYGFPQIMGIPTIVYRKDLVEEAGYDPEGENWATEPLTWKRFAEVTKDTQEQAGTDHGYTTAMNQRNAGSITGYEHLMTNGGNYFGDVSNQDGPIGDRPVTLDDGPVIDTLRQLRTFMYGNEDEHSIDGLSGGILPSESLGWDTNPSLESFSAGEAIMHRNWTFAIAKFGAEDAFGKDMGVMPYPYGVSESDAKYKGTGGSNAKLGGWHLSVNPNTEKLGATLEVIKAMTTDEYYLKVFEVTGEAPPKPGLIEEATNVDVMSRYLDTLKYQAKNQFAPPINAVWDAQKSAIGQEFQACLNREKTPEDAAAAAQDQVKQIEQQES